MAKVIQGRAYVVGDNIDTDQIIPAQYLNLVPTMEDEYNKLGSYALSGLPESYRQRFVAAGEMQTPYTFVVAGRNFGCGSSREHAPVSIGAAGAEAVIAESFARIFFRNCIATGEIYPLECKDRLCDIVKTGDNLSVDLDTRSVTIEDGGEGYALLEPGDVKDVIDAGGLFNYARQKGMIRKQ